MPTETRQRGLLYDQAAEFATRLEARDEAAALSMLNAWSDSYWGVRREMDQFLAKVAAARAAGERTSPAWAFQQRRIQTVMDQARAEMARYADQAAAMVTQRQRQVIQEGVDDATALGSTVVREGLPGLDVAMDRVNTAVLEKGVGFLADGSVLRNHLAATMPEDAAQAIRDALVQGLARGKSQDWMTRQATRALGLSHGRAVTILRTESLRAYRAASQAVYQANADVMGGWVWNAHLDARTCVACVLMDGTEHPLNSTLDGHPRCRCAMVPRTRSWEDILGEDGVGIPDTRPPVRSGKAWLEAQDPTTQRAIMGRAKFTAWQEGHVTLDDMVARKHDAAWGTMRTERSLKAITEGRDANWTDADTVDHPVPPGVTPTAPVTYSQARGTKDDPVVATVSREVFQEAVKPTQHLPSMAEARRLGLSDDDTWEAFLAYVDDPANQAHPRERIDYWRTQIRAGADVPPVRVLPPFGPTAKALMEDGHHRAAAYLLEGRPVPLRLGDGSLPEFLEKYRRKP